MFDFNVLKLQDFHFIFQNVFEEVRHSLFSVFLLPCTAHILQHFKYARFHNFQCYFHYFMLSSRT